ncbi:endonuclease [Sphingomonas koreensis]|uniref:Endonuclease n=1 Tax=Sphingomonas koreensis TaxID=93064 RepID=A0A430G6Q5_9SPHN|nr:Z1 domain-containing protein [Sphingomonas koreensis]RSY88182.1 endonuclease [Sphingomonas koreensis]
MSNTLDLLDTMVSQLIARQSPPTPESIRKAVDTLRVLPDFLEVSDDDAEMLARELEERVGISMGLGAIVEDQDFRPWLNDARAKGLIDPYYWKRYEQLLRAKRLPRDVIIAMDEVTDRVLDRMGNPGENSAWDRKGMVVGHVQSGKTANYTGLICKAADAGYRLIVVIAGIHNNLRNQTQARIDEGFIGRDTGRLEQKGKGRSRTIGVGNFDDRKVPVSLTNTIKDFNKTTATTNTSQISSYAVPVVLVIKKNSRTLANLVDWLKEHSVNRGSEMVDQPMLLIDDEADNASINIKYGKDEVSRINGQIRDLLGLFNRSCYVGYTATPFANIFIDPDSEDEVGKQDLFPRHFIIGLDAPTNYFGARKVFIDGVPEEGDPQYLRYITDNEDVLLLKHRIDHRVDELPGSLMKALRTFVVARTIRNLRGQAGQPASMLVNASRFTGIQNLLRNRLHEALEGIESAVRVDAAKGEAGLANQEIARLRDCWAEEYADVFPDWPAIQANLLPVLASATVVAVNSASPGSLDYDNTGEIGLTVIAVGGFSLSRGLTLEGLTVSYFLRNSMMYDTLMQMGRWFGYRANYEDLCRVWMLKEAAGWYAHIAEATEELQAELKRMEQVRATPEMFGLAVRSHPSALLVTARNKMGSGEKHVMIGLSNNFVETTKLSAEPASIDRNRQAAVRLLEALGHAGHGPRAAKDVPGGQLLEAVPVGPIDDFLREFDNCRDSILSDTGPIRKYIASRADDELAEWDVLVAGRKTGEVQQIGDWDLIPTGRSVGADDLKVKVLAISGKRSRVASRGVERTGLRADVAEAAERQYRLSQKIADGAAVNYPDWIYRAVRQRPLLVLFHLRIKPDYIEPEDWETVRDALVPAWSISFPRSARPDEKVEYILNTTKMRELFGEDDTDEDDRDDGE